VILISASNYAKAWEGSELDYSEASIVDSVARSIYYRLNTTALDYSVFYNAYTGYLEYKNNGVIKNENIITIIDFDKTSIEKRFFVIDLESKSILYYSYVAHGAKSGGLKAESFSNTKYSNQSSLGFYLTDNTYYGKHGLSLKLDGLEKGKNDKARERYIVIHSADYVSEEFILENYTLGNSKGCPAISEDIYKDVIRQIKNKSLLFIYSSNN